MLIFSVQNRFPISDRSVVSGQLYVTFGIAATRQATFTCTFSEGTPLTPGCPFLTALFVVSGQLYVGGREYQGTAPGRFMGLDLRENFYVGGVPDYSQVARASGYSQVST